MKTYRIKLIGADGDSIAPDRTVEVRTRDSIVLSHTQNGWTQTHDASTIVLRKGILDHVCIVEEIQGNVEVRDERI